MEMFNILCNLNENEMLEFHDLTTGQYLVTCNSFDL